MISRYFTMIYYFHSFVHQFNHYIHPPHSLLHSFFHPSNHPCTALITTKDTHHTISHRAARIAGQAKAGGPWPGPLSLAYRRLGCWDTPAGTHLLGAPAGRTCRGHLPSLVHQHQVGPGLGTHDQARPHRPLAYCGRATAVGPMLAAEARARQVLSGAWATRVPCCSRTPILPDISFF